MTSVHISSGLVLHQMTSDHNRSELRIHDHSNEPSSSKLVPKVVPLAVKTATSRQELELLFHHHIAMLRTTGINPMIQPELEDLPKDNPKLEIAVLRWHMLQLRVLKQNVLIESRAKRSIKISFRTHSHFIHLVNIISSHAVIKSPIAYHCDIARNHSE
ncbi:hypothetical protein Tco_0132265 [Tanacetum coccineum]